jgi:hypothetical protein
MRLSKSCPRAEATGSPPSTASPFKAKSKRAYTTTNPRPTSTSQRVKVMLEKAKSLNHHAKKLAAMSDSEFNRRLKIATGILEQLRGAKKANGKLPSKWVTAVEESGLSRSMIIRSIARIEEGKQARAGAGGRTRLVSPWVESQIIQRQSEKGHMGDGYTFMSFVKDVKELHLQEQEQNSPNDRPKELTAETKTLEKYFRKLFPESSYSDSKQNMARINAALNGCTSIAHATNIYATLLMALQDPALICNMDRTTIYLNKEIKYLVGSFFFFLSFFFFVCYPPF